MNKKTLTFLAIGLAILLVSSAIAAYILVTRNDEGTIRVACVGDSLTQSTMYPLDLATLLGGGYSVRNFGAGSTTVLRISETPYMNTSLYQNALAYEPNIVIIMLGTNDAQPSLHPYNASFVGDYVALVNSFQALASKPQIWVVLPPPLFSNQSGKISPEFLRSILIPDIEQAANQTNSPVIDVYSALLNYPNYFPDGEHFNNAAARLIANTIYDAINSQNATAAPVSFVVVWVRQQ